LAFPNLNFTDIKFSKSKKRIGFLSQYSATAAAELWLANWWWVASC